MKKNISKFCNFNICVFDKPISNLGYVYMTIRRANSKETHESLKQKFAQNFHHQVITIKKSYGYMQLVLVRLTLD